MTPQRPSPEGLHAQKGREEAEKSTAQQAVEQAADFALRHMPTPLDAVREDKREGWAEWLEGSKSSKGLHAQKGREAEYNLHAKQSGRGVFTYPNGSSIDTTPVPEGERLFSTQFDALDIAVNVDALQRSGPPRVPWRCRIGWHKWDWKAWEYHPWRPHPEPLRCARCGKTRL